jgi:FtsP/CotA-like multicopper oxidase with cupredoxin domain
MNTRKNIIVANVIALILAWGMIQGFAQTLTLSPGVDYTKPNYAYSGPIRKFVDTLPGLTPTGTNGVGQYIPLAVHNTPYGAPYGTNCDYYEIALVEYIERMHIDLPSSGTKLRGYVQIVSSNWPGAVRLDPAHGCSMVVTNGAGVVMYGADKPHYMGPFIIATKNVAVRVKFMNLLPTGAQGRLFVPVDTNSIMGAGDGWKQTGTDANGLPTYEKYTQNRATIHLHGGLPPWISDGTPHQWTVPAGEATTYKKGASAADVPDMGASQDGVITFYWPNGMSGRLMFYHDHAWGMTGATVYSGQAAGYLVVSPTEETALAAAGVPGTIDTDPSTGDIIHIAPHDVPIVIQDKTFVPSPAAVLAQDPNWTSDIRDGMTGVAPTEGNLWYPHVYIPNQWPDNPDQSGSNPLGRWDWGPWFWPIWPVAPGLVPPTVSHTPEAFMDTMMVNGQPYPYLQVDPVKYRYHILNACNDRMLNLQLYKATPGIVTNIAITAGGSGYDPLAPPFVTITGGGGRGATATATVNDLGVVTGVTVNIVGSGYTTPPTVAIEPSPGAGDQATATAEIYNLPTEVGMVPASPTAGISFPAPWRAQTIPYTPDILDGRVGGIPDPTNRGPAFLQIGTEGGLLPMPVVLPNTPVGYEQNKKNIVVLNVKEKTLFMAPAERADVVVDFSRFAGQTVILYNDSGAPVPAADGRCDLYTGNVDYTDAGGAPSTQAGMGPSTRTIMAFLVSGTKGATTPDYYDPALLTALNTTLPARFKAEQPAPVVPEAAYNAVGYLGGATTNLYSHIQDTSLSFVPYGTTHRVTMQMQPKTIQELFDDVGRLNATLGTELPFTTWAIQTTVPLNYVDPATENFNDGETQIWKITHNGVDSHGVHFHLFDVQVINRVGWDGQITPPDANERGWKDTVRMNPLEDIIVAMRAVKPDLTAVGWSVPKSFRLLNPAVPTNSLAGFSNLDPLTGNAFAPAMSNVWTDFGWEYAWHCHILGHEDNDMMRPVVMNVQDTIPAVPSFLTATLQTTPLQVNLAWTDNSVNEIGFQIERRVDGGPLWTTNGLAGANSRTFSDTTIALGYFYEYRVRSYNSAGNSGYSNIAGVSTVTGQPMPASLTATPSVLSTNSPTVAIRFVDNATTETGFTLERATSALFTTVTSFTLPANTVGTPATVGYVSYTNTGVAEATTYYYRVRANGAPQNSAWSNIASTTTPGRLPRAPTLVRSGGGATRTSIPIRWNDNSDNETGFQVYRGSSALGPWTLVTTTTANVTSSTVTGLVRANTYFFRVIAINAYGSSTAAVSSGLPTLP